MIPLLLFPIDITSFLRAFLFQLPARFTRYKHPRLFQSGGPGFWPGSGSLMRSRLIPKERPKSSGWRARWYSWKCTPARNRKPYEMRAGWNASELPGLPKLDFHSSDPPLSSSSFPLLVVQFTNEIAIQMHEAWLDCSSKCGWFLSRFRHRWNTSSFKIGFNFLFEFNDARNYTSYL